MHLFGNTLEVVELRLESNVKKTKGVFPEESSQLETGLELMRNLTKEFQDIVNEYPKKPSIY
jgi:hypothetical protein